MSISAFSSLISVYVPCSLAFSLRALSNSACNCCRRCSRKASSSESSSRAAMRASSSESSSLVARSITDATFGSRPAILASVARWRAGMVKGCKVWRCSNLAGSRVVCLSATVHVFEQISLTRESLRQVQGCSYTSRPCFEAKIERYRIDMQGRG